MAIGIQEKNLMRTAQPRKSSSSSCRGTALVELAIVLPMFLLLAFAMIEATRICLVAQILTNAAREGCRVAVTNGMVTQDVQNRIQATLDTNDPKLYPLLNPMVLTPSITASTPGLNNPITLTLSIPFNNVNWLSPSFFFTNYTVRGSATMASQRQ